MTLADNLQQLMALDQDGANAEINLKVKPLTNSSGVSALASDPTSVGAGGDTGGAGSGAGGGGTPGGGGGPLANPVDTATLPAGFGQGGESVVPINQRQTMTNPQLVTHPLGARTDDIYEAAIAQLQQQTQSQYRNTMRDLGWVNDQGQFIAGNHETQAIRDRAEINRQRELKLQDIIEGAVRGGTVFSGRRAQLQEQGIQPYDVALSNLETKLGRDLSSRYESLGELTRGFELSRNQLIADAAARYQASLEGGPAAGDLTGGGGETAPTAPVNTDPYGTAAVNAMMEQFGANLQRIRAQADALNAQGKMLPRNIWEPLHLGGNYDAYVRAWKVRNPSGGGGGGSARVQ